MLNIALYGLNGHQIHGRFLKKTDARVRLAAVAGFTPQVVDELRAAGIPAFEVLPDLDALLSRSAIDVVVLCSPRRDAQATECLRCLNAGKHAYAEKPCALNEEDLDRLVITAARVGRTFHEMAGTAFKQPYLAMRQVVDDGRLGDIVQVLAQKSYPMHVDRAQDEGVDGGLIGQCAIHAVRMIEHVTGVRVASVDAVETSYGNAVPGGGLRVAASLLLRLENGGVGAVVANYLNPHAFGRWGNETLRIFGTSGMLEATDGGTRTRLVLGDRDEGPLNICDEGLDWFTAVADEILDGRPMPLPLEDELHPTRIVIRANLAAKAHGCILAPAGTQPKRDVSAFAAIDTLERI